MRTGLLPKGYERLEHTDLEALSEQYHAGRCGADELRSLLIHAATWMYDFELSDLAQRAKKGGIPVETPDGSAIFALYFRTADEDLLAFAFPRRTSGELVRAYVKLQPEYGIENDLVHRRSKAVRVRKCSVQAEKIARMIEGSIRDYHEERG